jgi:PEGA domain
MIRRGGGAAVRRSSATALLLCAVGASMTPGEASAQPAAAPVETQVNADARQLFLDGQTATKMLQWDRARTFFQGAWRIQQHWKIAASLGRAELKVGRMRDAAEHLAFALREVPPGALGPEELKPVEEMLAQARAKVGAVKVTGAPDGAEVSLDGVVVGKAPIKEELFLEPGVHRVGGKRDGYGDGAGEVTAVAGEVGGVDLRMVRVPEVKAVGLVGGEVKAAPAAVGPNKVVVIAGAALTVVGVGMGVGFAVAGLSKEAERDRLIASDPRNAECSPDSHKCLPAVHHADVAKATFARISLASYIAAGVIGAATLTYTLFPRSPKKDERLKASMVAGPGLAVVTLSGTW